MQIGPRRVRVRAREADASERRRLWPEAPEYNPHWATYRTRTIREIPLVLLEPSPLSHLVGLICLVEVPASAGVEDQRSGGEVPQA